MSGPTADAPAGSAPERIDVMRPWIGDDEVAAVVEAVRSGWVAQGPRVAEFERRFAAAVGARHAVAVSNCTAGLHLSLVVAGIGAGDDVVVPSFSFIATTNAVLYVGARPVFADVDAVTGNLTVETIAAVVTPATRAVILVHQGGVPADVDTVRRWCAERGITVVEDAACAAGSVYRDAPVGTGATVAAWSFHPRKLVTTGEGGMVTTDDDDWAVRLRRLREHAMSVSAADRHASRVPVAEQYLEVGFNYRMTDLQAALGIVQLGRLPEMVRRRREIAAVYHAELSGIPGIRVVEDPPWGRSNFQSCWIEIGEPYPLDREGLLLHFAELGISARRGIMAAHLQPAYAGTPHAPLPVTEHLTASTLILPVFHELDRARIARVVDAVATPALALR